MKLISGSFCPMPVREASKPQSNPPVLTGGFDFLAVWIQFKEDESAGHTVKQRKQTNKSK
ncbi:hypothetical protein [Bacillus sp. P14.5]|uniref:hypothetical protein n=1 Tax=Bacillus sp. P14.5 TaxID=1983400 RepID=UPI000DEB4BC2|nr:hypothetical protein [Bacillus sp. P14.5]